MRRDGGHLHLGLVILVIGVLAVAFVRPKTYIARLINLEIPAWGFS